MNFAGLYKASLSLVLFQTDNDPLHSFTETFYLKQFGDSLFVMNQVFRLALHHS